MIAAVGCVGAEL